MAFFLFIFFLCASAPLCENVFFSINDCASLARLGGAKLTFYSQKIAIVTGRRLPPQSSSRRVPAKLTHTSCNFCVDKLLDRFLGLWQNEESLIVLIHRPVSGKNPAATFKPTTT